MSQIWIGPVVLVVLCLVWFAVQRAWLKCMDQPAESDALARPSACGTSCACQTDCPRRREGTAAESSKEEK
ncbi:hypothetical protein IC757_03835 [Wenzhouxiangella sp. AB-CW3]|uniref:hypothetical protein n=1 Tax=Wenzhouxiangella sp. AB-CW3 TaxID=2771012 RepID=UPI00168A68A4|nr:hypothetical protein [Wenzhouxiangella sp. AB-CW3]QOC23292.1 hypothetical protein IC757_03835 [Wenzhouxiangella sp. AB-CW3]